MISFMEPFCNAQKVVVLGATGLIGNLLTRKLLELTNISEVITVGRRSPEIDHIKLKKINIDMERFDEKADFLIGVDAVFCCLGTTMKQAKSKSAFRKVDFEIPLLAAKAAKTNGIHHFLLVSAQGASISSPFYYSRVKGEIEQVLKQICFQRVTIARPGLLLGRKSGDRVFEDMAAFIMKRFNPLFQGPLKKFVAVNASDVAVSLIQSYLGNDTHISGLELIEIKNECV